MRALSIRQPWAELILRGVKTVEYRSRPTRVIEERFWIYASQRPRVGGPPGTPRVWSRDLAPPGGGPPQWMMELARELILAGELPTGVIVGRGNETCPPSLPVPLPPLRPGPGERPDLKARIDLSTSNACDMHGVRRKENYAAKTPDLPRGGRGDRAVCISRLVRRGPDVSRSDTLSSTVEQSVPC